VTVPLPQRVFRTQTLYRSAARGPSAAVDCGFMLKPDSHHAYRDRVVPHYVAVYVLRGAGAFTDAHGRSHRVGPGCLIQHPPGETHSLVHDPDGQWAEFFFILPGDLYRTLVRLGSVGREPVVLRPGLDPALVTRCEELMEEVRRSLNHDAAMSIARGHELLVALWRAHLHQREPQHADAIDEACRALASDLHRDLDLPSLARRLGLSYDRFRKLFRQRVGQSPGEYRIRRRIDRARTLIAEDRLSNKEVAYRLGYPDPFTFSKQFKRYVGVSPKAFRETL
jgi:AraC-like DNA-binding protein